MEQALSRKKRVRTFKREQREKYKLFSAGEIHTSKDIKVVYNLTSRNNHRYKEVFLSSGCLTYHRKARKIIDFKQKGKKNNSTDQHCCDENYSAPSLLTASQAHN